MRLFLIVLLRIVVFVLLTALTQIGGVIYLLSVLLSVLLSRKRNYLKPRLQLSLVFTALYLTTTFLIVPYVAPFFGRVKLESRENLRPVSSVLVLLNRTYVKPQLADATYKAADAVSLKFPKTITVFLDGNFPFLDGFPLLPHLSHKDGKKLDLAFYYSNDEHADYIPEAIGSLLGYGYYESPRIDEENWPKKCAQSGKWMYGLLGGVVSQDKMIFLEKDRTVTLINVFTEQSAIGKIFIEPHLKSRWGLTSSKIRFHGCHAVRHDDHIHVQIK